MINKKVEIAIVSIAVIAVIGVVIACCAIKPEYDENGNMIEITSYEEITELTTEMVFEASTETTSYETTSETTTYEQVNGHIVESVENLPTSPIDKYITYDNKQIKLNDTMDTVKSVLGNPIVILEESSNADSEEATGYEITTEATTLSPTDNNTAENSHRYREFIIRTEIKDGKELVKNIEVVSPLIENAAGISPIDKEIFEITLSYGVPSYEDWSVCQYDIDEDSYLYFNLIDGKVSTWGIALKEKPDDQDDNEE